MTAPDALEVRGPDRGRASGDGKREGERWFKN
jgi:hypothetical protein